MLNAYELAELKALLKDNPRYTAGQILLTGEVACIALYKDEHPVGDIWHNGDAYCVAVYENAGAGGIRKADGISWDTPASDTAKGAMSNLLHALDCREQQSALTSPDREAM